MTKLRPTDDCSEFERWLTPYVDGELDAVHTIDVEDHLDRCDCCAERVTLTRAMRSSLRCSVRAKAPAALRDRLRASLAAEHERGDAADALPAVAASDGDRRTTKISDAPHAVAVRRPRLASMRIVFPLAAAAMLVIVVGAMQVRESESSAAAKPRAKTGLSGAPIGTAPTLAALELEPLDRLIDDLVSQHAAPLPPETNETQSLEKFDRFVGVRVPKPKFEGFDARYLGARVHPVRGKRGSRSARTAMLQYMLKNRHRVTVYVFDPQRVPMHATRMEHRKVGKQKIYVGRLRGYSVAASANGGIGYALASDLDGDQNAELVRVAAK